VFTQFLGWGKSWLAGGILLAMMILPTVTVATITRIESIPPLQIEAARGLGVGLSIAYTILGVPLVGLAIGWALDSHYQSNVFKGLGTVSGAVLGIILAFWMMNRQNN